MDIEKAIGSVHSEMRRKNIVASAALDNIAGRIYKAMSKANIRAVWRVGLIRLADDAWKVNRDDLRDISVSIPVVTASGRKNGQKPTIIPYIILQETAYEVERGEIKYVIDFTVEDSRIVRQRMNMHRRGLSATMSVMSEIERLLVKHRARTVRQLPAAAKVTLDSKLKRASGAATQVLVSAAS